MRFAKFALTAEAVRPDDIREQAHVERSRLPLSRLPSVPFFGERSCMRHENQHRNDLQFTPPPEAMAVC